MNNFPQKRSVVRRWVIGIALIAVIPTTSLRAQQASLQAIVTPSTILSKEGHVVAFAVHGFIEFKSLADLFPYIESQTRRWQANGGLDDAGQRHLARELLRRGIESRVLSMVDERPLETLMTHTSEELRQALAQVKEPVPPGYTEEFLAVQEKWKHSLNCWSAASSIPGRALQLVPDRGRYRPLRCYL